MFHLFVLVHPQDILKSGGANINPGKKCWEHVPPSPNDTYALISNFPNLIALKVLIPSQQATPNLKDLDKNHLV